jgi:hypothetical protein
MNYDYSFYIPRVHSSWSAKNVIDYFHTKMIGHVYRVDFTPMSNNLPTDNHYYFVDDKQMYSAFVHIHELYKNELTSQIIKSIDEVGQYKLNIETSGEYWYLRKCNTPLGIPIYNTSQLSELIRRLEEKVIEQQRQIEMLVHNITENNNSTSFSNTVLDMNESEILCDLAFSDSDSKSAETYSSMPSLVSVSSSPRSTIRMDINELLCEDD